MSDSFSDVFSYDPILSKMDDPNILWGDLLREPKLAKQSTPNLSNRKVIQKHYPVIVRIHEYQDSQDSHEYQDFHDSQKSMIQNIQWRVSKLAEWRTTNPNPLEWKSYEVNVVRTMISELQKSGWKVLAPTHPSFICSITRNECSDCNECSESSESAECTKSTENKDIIYKDSDESVKSVWVYKEPSCPTMLCLNDIKLFFPVIWHKLESNCKMYSLELYHDKIRTTATSHGVLPERLTNHLSSLLTTTLSQSPAWNVVKSQMVGEYCRLVVV